MNKMSSDVRSVPDLKPTGRWAVYLGTVRIRIAIDVSISNMINRLIYITYSILIIIFFVRVWLSGNALPRLSINEVTLRPARLVL